TLRRLRMGGLRRGPGWFAATCRRFLLFAAARNGVAAAHVIVGIRSCRCRVPPVAILLVGGFWCVIVLAPGARFCASISLRLGLRLRFGLFLQERLPVGERDLIIVGMNFAEGQETVTVAAVVDERRL